MRVGLFTNNYLPFRGGVTTAVETLRRGLEAAGHDAWIFAPGAAAPVADPPNVFRYPSVPAPTYPGFSLALPWSRRLRTVAVGLGLDVVHAQHPGRICWVSPTSVQTKSRSCWIRRRR